MYQITKPGWPRRLSASFIILVAAAVAYILTTFDIGFSDIQIAVAIFVTSLVSFSVLALLTFDSQRAWRAVDYPWVFISFATLMVTLISISEVEWNSDIQELTFPLRSDLVDLFSSGQREIQINCNKPNMKPGDVAACDLVSAVSFWALETSVHLDAPQHSEDEHTAVGLARNGLPFSNMLDEAIKNSTGNWAFTKVYMDQIVAGGFGALEIFMENQAKRFARRDQWQYFLAITDVRYWYFIIAFFVGLRLSRTTAELLQTWFPRS